MVTGPLHMLRVMSIALTLFALLPGAANAGADMKKVLRISMNDITSLDPQQGTDLYSTRVTTAIFEAMYEFEYLSTGSKVIPNTAEAMPAITDDGRTWTMRVKKGICSPTIRCSRASRANSSPRTMFTRSSARSTRSCAAVATPALTDLIVGARPVVDAARKPDAKFDYDAPIEGLQASIATRCVMRLAQPDYTLLERLAGLPTMAVAREAIEAAGADVMRQPVGTGPYRLKEWRRASRIVLEANPNYRTVRFPETADAPQQELVRNMRGKTLPQIGRIEISIIEESQPRLLAFTQGRPRLHRARRRRHEARAGKRQAPAGARRSAASSTSASARRASRSRTSTWRSGRRRLRDTSRSRCAARSAWASTSTS